MAKRKTKESEVPGPTTAKIEQAKPRALATKRKKEMLPAVQNPAAVSLTSLVKEAIMNPAIEKDKMTGLVDWYTKRMADNAFARDFLAMAKHLPEIKRDGTIDQGITKSGRAGVKAKYATFENIHEATSEVLHNHGFTLSVVNRAEGGTTYIVLMLEHYDPEFGSSLRQSFRPLTVDAGPGKTVVQAEESGGAYLKRRMIINILNLRSRAPEDQDHDGGKPPKMLTTEEQRQLEEYALAIEPVTPEGVAPLIERLLSHMKCKTVASLDFDKAMQALRSVEANKPRAPQAVNTEGS